ncbi:MAG: hypothetical protein QNI92_00420 [Desulfobacterales bacterium]|nr:hypothetical protein [Desulfobacterales bacterium]
MSSTLLKITTLSIVFMGVVILLAGIALLLFQKQIAPYMRYLLPIPPIGVAAYVFVYNMFAKYDGKLPGTVLDSIKEICLASVLSFVFFLIFTVILVFMVDVTK